MNALFKAGVFAAGLSLAMLSPAVIAGSSKSATAAPAAEAGTTVNYGWDIVWNANSARMVHVETGREVQIYRDEKGATEEDGYTNYEMLSVVGPVISYAVDWYSEGGAHPSYGKAITTLDISKLDSAGDKGGNIRESTANLAELFGEEAVFRQLAANPSVRAAIRGQFSDIGGAVHDDPRSLDELLKAADGGCRASMGESLLTDFHFLYRLDKRIAVVEIGLTHGCEAMRGEFTFLPPIYLEIPDNLAEDFERAVHGGTLEHRNFTTPSFNCHNAGNPIEYAICGDAELAELDITMARRYKAARRGATGDGKESIKRQQRAWIAARNKRCATPDNEKLFNGEGEFFPTIGACLKQLYETRLAELQ